MIFKYLGLIVPDKGESEKALLIHKIKKMLFSFMVHVYLISELMLLSVSTF